MSNGASILKYVAITSKCETLGFGLQIKWSFTWIPVFVVTSFTYIEIRSTVLGLIIEKELHNVADRYTVAV